MSGFELREQTYYAHWIYDPPGLPLNLVIKGQWTDPLKIDFMDADDRHFVLNVTPDYVYRMSEKIWIVKGRTRTNLIPIQYRQDYHDEWHSAQAYDGKMVDFRVDLSLGMLKASDLAVFRPLIESLET